MKYCYKCKYLIVKKGGAGGIWYSCKLSPGIIIGESNFLDGDNEPIACEKYQWAQRGGGGYSTFLECERTLPETNDLAAH